MLFCCNKNSVLGKHTVSVLSAIEIELEIASFSTQSKGAAIINGEYPPGVFFKGSQIFGQKNKGSQIFRRKFKGSQINFKV